MMAVDERGSTSAAGPMSKRPTVESVLCIVGFLGLPGFESTSGQDAAGYELVGSTTLWTSTSAGSSIGATEDAGTAIAELRRRTGLTWDQLARLFDVSRRAVHFWASGKAMNAANEERLSRAVAVARRLDCGSASASRVALLAVGADGMSLFDLLVAGQYERAASLAGSHASDRSSRPRPSAARLAARVPRAPEDLVDDHDDRAPRASGRLLASKPVRVTRRK